jgi:hypothetical protein
MNFHPEDPQTLVATVQEFKRHDGLATGMCAQLAKNIIMGKVHAMPRQRLEQ